jgi:DNA-binding transcriptional MerR regulator
MGDFAFRINRRYAPLRVATAEFGLGEKLLRSLADKGLIQAGRTPGGHRRYNLDSIEAYLNRRHDEQVARDILVSLGP